MRKLLLPAAVLAWAASAQAQDVAVKPLAEARLRYEHVEQADLPLEADAMTLRVRAGIAATTGPFTATVQAQGTLALVDDYNDGLSGPATRPLVADPENLALYVAQLQYRAQPITLTAGRQRIALDDERFVGNVGFRQNAQTFDAVRAEIVPFAGLKADVTYAWSVRTIWGTEGFGARPTAIGGDNVFANLSWASPVGTLSAFANLVDQDEAAVQRYRLSSQNYGARLAGSRSLAPGVRLSWQLSYAAQSDYGRNPNDYRADYYLGDVALELGALRLNAGYEVLGAGEGADGGTPFTSFQTPLGTNFKFQGWADKFLATPPGGVRDLYAGVSYGWKEVGPFASLGLQAVYHRFESDRPGLAYGEEIDLVASAAIETLQLSARYAGYAADLFGSDTDKFWLQLDWSL
jgi:hypothetical protein